MVLTGGLGIGVALFGVGTWLIDCDLGRRLVGLLSDGSIPAPAAVAPAILGSMRLWSMLCANVYTLAIAVYCLIEFCRGGEACAAMADRARVLVLDARHSVGNQLALIAGALRAQARGNSDRLVQEALETAQLRILVVAETLRLKSVGDSDRLVEAKPLLQKLVVHLQMFAHDRAVEIETEFDEFDLSERDATSFMLIINELVVNAIMYGFPGEQAGRVRIALRQCGRGREQWHILTIEDDGAGGDRRTPGDELGFSIVTTMVHQLGATIEYANHDGEVARTGARAVVARNAKQGASRTL